MTEMTYQHTYGHEDQRFEHKETVSAGNTGGWIKLPVYHRPVSVTVDPNSSCTVQFTTSPEADVDGGTALAQDWPKGSVNSVTNDLIEGPVTAVRLKASGGNADIEVMA